VFAGAGAVVAVRVLLVCLPLRLWPQPGRLPKGLRVALYPVLRVQSHSVTGPAGGRAGSGAGRVTAGGPATGRRGGINDRRPVIDRTGCLRYLGATCPFAYIASRAGIFIAWHPHPPPMTGAPGLLPVSGAHAQTAVRMSRRMLTGSCLRRGQG